MKNALKAVGVLVCVVTLSACAVSPTPIERTRAEFELAPGVHAERVTLADKNGTTTYDVVDTGGEIKLYRHNKASTAQQDMARTIAGAVSAPIANGIVAHSLKNRSSDCGSGGCGGGQQVMQLQVQTSSGSVSEAAAGCPTCALFE